MVAPDAGVERRALRVSLVAAAGLGVAGVLWGIATGSQLILLDGAYAFIGVAVSWLLLAVSRAVGRGPNHVYPYGRQALTPLVVGVQGFVLLGTVAYAAVDAVNSILAGGEEVAAGWALAYGVLTLAASLVVWRLLLRMAPDSDLVGAEATAWRVSAVLAGGMVIGFGAMLALEGGARSDWVPYLDPALVLVAAVVLVPAPLGMVRTTFVELVEASPPADVQAPVRAAVAAIEAEYGVTVPDLRMTKVGPKLYVEVDGVAPPTLTIADEHAMRLDLERRLDALPFDVWLNFELFPADAH
ncbi:MAG: cation diffusion facilitator family transporter [Acidimicrobiales bacterium]|nr:cation diffusion facilitator family transporter [Acidimicrobiales bacterium]